VSDLNIKLVSPSNREVTLFNRRGGSSDNLSNTRFSDSAGVSIAAGAAPFTGVFRPESLLAAFRGINALGNWRLVVSDNSPMYSGELLSWSIDVTARTLPAISLRNNTAVSLAAGATISSTIQVTRALSINDINVTLGLNVAQAGDVSIVLKSARGDSVVLFNGLTTVNPALAVGFDDQSNTAIPSVSQPGQQGAPQSRLLPGTFRPASTLSRFNSLSRVAAGTWTLEIKDNRSQGSGPASTLTGWGMSIIALAG
jgi:subtilisin-like proprotein convertase family protein